MTTLLVLAIVASVALLLYDQVQKWPTTPVEITADEEVPRWAINYVKECATKFKREHGIGSTKSVRSIHIGHQAVQWGDRAVEYVEWQPVVAKENYLDKKAILMHLTVIAMLRMYSVGDMRPAQ